MQPILLPQQMEQQKTTKHAKVKVARCNGGRRRRRELDHHRSTLGFKQDRHGRLEDGRLIQNVAKNRKVFVQDKGQENRNGIGILGQRNRNGVDEDGHKDAPSRALKDHAHKLVRKGSILWQ